MSDPEDWKTANTAAVTSATSLVASSSAAGLTDIANAGIGVTSVIVNYFSNKTGPEAVPEKNFTELEAKVRYLEAETMAAPGSHIDAFQCNEAFDASSQTATTKLQKFNCYSSYLACLVCASKNPISIG